MPNALLLLIPLVFCPPPTAHNYSSHPIHHHPAAVLTNRATMLLPGAADNNNNNNNTVVVVLAACQLIINIRTWTHSRLAWRIRAIYRQFTIATTPHNQQHHLPHPFPVRNHPSTMTIIVAEIAVEETTPTSPSRPQLPLRSSWMLPAHPAKLYCG